MKTRNEYIRLLRSQEAVLRQDFGIRSLRLFGSVARQEQNELSDECEIDQEGIYVF